MPLATQPNLQFGIQHISSVPKQFYANSLPKKPEVGQLQIIKISKRHCNQAQRIMNTKTKNTKVNICRLAGGISQMTKMRQLILLILTFFLLADSFAQTTNSTELSLTKRNLKRIFKIQPNICCPARPEWTACDKDSSYYKSDTVRLYNNDYYHLTAKCCHFIDWTFSNSTTFTLTELFNCNEPPISTASPHNYGLKIKFKKENNTLIMSIYKKRKLKDRFVLLSLDNVELTKGQQAYRLTMVRKNFSLVNESW